MAAQSLPDGDHAVRLVKPSLVMRHPETNEVVGCFPQAFRLRDDERDLSVSWLEFFPGMKTERLQQVRNHAELKLSRNHVLACLNVGAIRSVSDALNLKLRILHEPTAGNPAHATIHRYPRDNDELFAILADMAARDLTPLRDLAPEPP